jgi:hypothetical protein
VFLGSPSPKKLHDMTRRESHRTSRQPADFFDSCRESCRTWRNTTSVIGLCGASRRCTGGFAKLVAGNVENGKAPTLLWERLEIRLDKNLDRLFARINLDTNGALPKSTSWRRPFFPRMMAWGITVSALKFVSVSRALAFSSSVQTGL